MKDERIAEQIEKDFKYYAPNPEQIDKYTALRAKAKEFAEMINDLCPASRDKALAITHVEESVMWANAAIARHTPEPEPEPEPEPAAPRMDTTSGRPVEVVRAEQTEATGQHKDYIVLSEEERAKGFVRPVRKTYLHVGRSVCATIKNADADQRLGGPRDVCALPNNHEGDCDGPFFTVNQPEHAEVLVSHLHPAGCGSVTTMGDVLAETYARDPSFYGATFCVSCNKHLPVGEFVWDGTNEVVGS